MKRFSPYGSTTLYLKGTAFSRSDATVNSVVLSLHRKNIRNPRGRISSITVVVMALVSLMVSCNGKTRNTITDMKGIHEDWSKSAVIYEVNVRQYTPEGTFKAFEAHLPQLHKMGVDILWFMPIYPIGEKNRKGTLGSYYAVRDFKGVNREFGTFDEFKSLVKKAHKLGMKVILDWVANHAAWDNVWTVSDPQFFKRGENGDFVSPYDWSDVIALDYDNIEMRQAMVDALKFWIIEADIDGFRCDVAGLVPTDFWDEARRELETIKPLFMLAEDEDNPDLLREAFDMNYTWKLHKIMNGIAKGEKPLQELYDYFEWNKATYPSKSYRMNFITNHDENSWNGTEFERLGDGVEAFAAFTFVIPGMPLIYSGQEAGLDRRLHFFDKDSIDFTSRKYFDFYTKLIKIRKKYSPLWSGEYGAGLEKLNNSHPEQIFSFLRQNDEGTIMAIFNFSNRECNEVKFSIGGNWKNLLNGDKVRFRDVTRISLKPWEYLILKQK